jgi:hypothetical protein
VSNKTSIRNSVQSVESLSLVGTRRDTSEASVILKDCSKSSLMERKAPAKTSTSLNQAGDSSAADVLWAGYHAC